ncbi:hypothetical protein Slin14017_G110660 [Septoria linicola]|nr:hypothetical protein Slin14017_G110660 [Septoria linicola]
MIRDRTERIAVERAGSWQPDEVETLIRLSQAGLTPGQIATQLDRSRFAVWSKLRIGKVAQAIGQSKVGRWDDVEKASLRTLAEDGCSAEDIAQKLKRSLAAVRRMLLREKSKVARYSNDTKDNTTSHNALVGGMGGFGIQVLMSRRISHGASL